MRTKLKVLFSLYIPVGYIAGREICVEDRENMLEEILESNGYYIKDLGEKSGVAIDEDHNVGIVFTFNASRSGMSFDEWFTMLGALSCMGAAERIGQEAMRIAAGTLIPSVNNHLNNDIYPQGGWEAAQGSGGTLKIEGRGQSSGGHQPISLKEQLAVEQAQSNPGAGRKLFDSTDPRWPGTEGWAKYTQNINGVEVHYQYNSSLGLIDDFKIK